MKSPRKVLVLYEQGRAGAAAIDLARDLAEREKPTLTVVAVAPQAPSGPRCGNSALEYNEAVAESVAQDLDQARERLGPAAPRAPRSCSCRGRRSDARAVRSQRRLRSRAAAGAPATAATARQPPRGGPARGSVAGAEIRIVAAGFAPAAAAAAAARRRRWLIRIAAPIAAPKNSAPIQNGLTSSTTAMPSIVSQIAGLQSRQSPVTAAANLVAPASSHAHASARPRRASGSTPPRGTPLSDSCASAR